MKKAIVNDKNILFNTNYITCIMFFKTLLQKSFYVNTLQKE